MGVSRRVLGALVVVSTLLLVASAAAAAPPSPGGPALSTDQALDDKRYVAAGDQAYVIGSEDGRFPPMGWHIRGEMGGVWAHPVKLLDGYWFAVDDTWLPAATRYTTGAGYVQMRFPDTAGYQVTRTEFSPDGLSAVLVGLTIRNTDQQRARPFKLTMQAHSEVMGAYPWGWTTPNAKQVNGKDTGACMPGGESLLFRESGKPWYAQIAAQTGLEPDACAVGDEFWGPVPPEERAGYNEFGNGTGGQLRWNVNLSAGGETTVWIAVAGSHLSRDSADRTLRQALSAPGAQLAAKVAKRRELLSRTQVDLPDAGLQAAFDWGKLNMADLRRTSTRLQIRDVDEGRAYPDSQATLPRFTGIGAGFPDYPWYFGTDGAYTAHPLVASGQWETAIEHLRGIRDVSRIVNGDTGKVVHEVVTDGSVYFGANDDAGNTNETAQFATAVHLLWRWSGSNSFRDEMYGFVKDGLEYVTSTLDADDDLWPEGSGMVERGGMGAEKLDVTAYTWQALRALAEMAASKGDGATADWARSRADAMADRLDAAWWMPSENLYADSLCNAPVANPDPTWINYCTAAGQRLQQRHWINATPMETTLAPTEHANTALDTLEGPNHTGSCGLFHTGVGGGPTGAGERKCWTLPNSVMAMAEANYGRLADNQALRYQHTISGDLTLEMPGALPEISPSPEYDPFVDFRDRAMFMQAWSSYGVQWPVINNYLGIRPDVPHGKLDVVADVPDSWPGLSVSHLRVGSGSLTAAATREGKTHTTTLAAAPAGWELTLGHVVPAGAQVASVTLDGVVVSAATRTTTRGKEVYVQATTGAPHTLVVTIA
jgi:Mannosylglycerate hydrolase MGH1-like glycoside hydrolase domain